ncbi:VPA1262 family protein [Pseudomonas peli]|uniref:VPA1262 family protein n=1 Tax=Pseudomonas peli TaxID=592361 RepID=UPI0024AC99DF|nr:VPA1262 family protein [Pseudomonas peli]
MTIRKDTRKESMAPTLDDLLSDDRLARLFSTDARHCALQLWILQIRSEQQIENRIVYGRLLPYSYSSDSWSSSDDDKFQGFGQFQAQVARLNLYVKSVHCADLLQQLSAGRSISKISEELKIGLPDQLKERFGTTALAADDLFYRPVAYLLNRDAHDRHSISSPDGGAGAFSASISQSDKGALFRLGQDYDAALTRSVVRDLGADTGLDFGGADTSRFGDLELLVFPALDDLERRLLSVTWVNEPRALIACFNSAQVPHFNGFQFHLRITNGDQVVYSNIVNAERNAEGIFECKFFLDEQLHARVDSTELEVFGIHGDPLRGGTLCCRWGTSYVREIHFQGHVVGRGANSVKFDWLERATRPAASSRVKAALTISRGNMDLASRVGGHEADPWVPINRDLASLFTRLHPPKSEGKFFQRFRQSDGEGRLQFVEWFKTLLAKYQQHQVIIFDPYFESAGLGLMLICAAQQTDYIVFRSLPKPINEDKPLRRKSDKAAQEGVNNLLANCEQSRHLIARIKLRIYGLKEGRLHDRYILIMGSDGLPVAGFNLSNSFQNAAENYPLLVTPIPSDVLLQVEQYKSALLREAKALQSGGETGNPSMRILFDSTASPTVPRRYEPLRFLEKTQAGDVLSVWAGEPSLQGLSGDPLRERMVTLNMLKGDSLALPQTESLRNCLERQACDLEGFTATWEVLGELLAHSRTEDIHFHELESERGILECLVQFLNSSFNRTHERVDKELAVTDTRFFREPVETLLRSSYQPHHFFHATKYAALTWAEYFTIKFLWWYASDALLEIAEAQMVEVPMELQESDAVRLSLLSQIINEIALSLQFEVSEVQQLRLVHSSSGLLQWMGLNAIEMKLETPEGLDRVLQLVSDFPYREQVRALGWMICHAAGKPDKGEIYKGLIAILYGVIAASISGEELRHMVDSMRGHMRHLTWAEPWLPQDVIFPLLQKDRANTDDACGIWIQELSTLLEPTQKNQSRLFELSREGQMTNTAAFLFAYSGPEQQQSSLKTMRAILRRQQRIVQQPLASTSDWTRWHDALVVSMWILTFARWSEYYLRERGITEHELERLSLGARDLAMVRPMDEWRSEGAGEGDLAVFLDQVEELLA